MKRCDIPARSLPPCDLEWGHPGDMHSNAGDGFWAHDHDERHHRRQAARAKKKALAWTREAALAFIAMLHPRLAAAGHGLALAGSLLLTESSEHDLDLVVFPLDSSRYHRDEARAALQDAGMVLAFDRAFVEEMWRKKGSKDEKNVDVWQTAEGRRVDVFWLR